MYLILVYDITLDEKGKKILPKVFKTCKKYLFHIQNSVFEGDLSEPQIMQLQKDLSKHIRKEQDSLIIFKSRDKRWMKKEFWGRPDDATSMFL